MEEMEIGCRNQLWQGLEGGCRNKLWQGLEDRCRNQLWHGLGDGCRNQLWHGLEDGCRNPMLGDCALLPSPRGSLLCPNSKHWFTTSFLQPLPYLVTSQIPENCQLTSIFFFFVGAQTVVRLLQTIQIKQDVSFIAANKVYTSTNKTTIVWIEMELFFFFLPGVDASHVYVGAWALGCFHSHN